MVSVKGTASKLEMDILSGVIEPNCSNIEFKNVTFDCKSIKDAAGHIFINQTYCNESDKKEAKDDKPCWIPCEEKLPEQEEKVYLVYLDNGHVCDCKWWCRNLVSLEPTEHWRWDIFDLPQYGRVLAWMPLPEPYDGERKDDEDS